MTRKIMQKPEEAVFARINGRWKFEGFFDDRLLISELRKHINRTQGPGNFFSVVLPSKTRIDLNLVDNHTSGSIPYLDVGCPKCGVQAGQNCLTSTGNFSFRPHSQRIRAMTVRTETTNLLV